MVCDILNDFYVVTFVDRKDVERKITSLRILFLPLCIKIFSKLFSSHEQDTPFILSVTLSVTVPLTPIDEIYTLNSLLRHLTETKEHLLVFTLTGLRDLQDDVIGFVL